MQRPRDRDAQLREALRLGDAWQRRQGAEMDPEHGQRCHDAARDALSDLTDQWHTTDLPRAEKTCAAHRRLFPDEPLPECPAPQPPSPPRREL